MPKHYDNTRTYRSSWETTYTWLKSSSNGTRAFCKLCSVEMLPRLSLIKRHEESTKHQQNIPRENILTRNIIATPRGTTTSDDTKAAEIELSAAVVCHCSIMTIDHVGEIINRNGKGSSLEKVKLHRTKCAAIIKECISSAIKEDLMEHLQDKKYVVVVDESTDVSSQKLLCVAVTYVSDNVEEGILTDFLSLVPVTEATAETLFKALEEELNTFGLPLENCIGFSSDGAAVMVGKNNSVWTRLKEKAPYCIQLKCICHSLALCIQHAFSELPSNLSFLLKEIPSWFSHSSIRRESFQNIFSIMNADTGLESGTSAPTPFQKLSATRWLVRGKVMNNILTNYDELLAYFTVAQQALKSQPDARFKARLLKDMLQDRVNHLLLHFATPIVQEFERVNSMFQTNSLDAHQMLQELDIHFKCLCNRVYSWDGSLKDIASCDFGAKFEAECKKFLESLSQPTREREEARILEFKERCRNMLTEACSQVEKRLPDNKDVFKKLQLLSPHSVLNQASKPKFSELPFLHLIGDMNAAEEEYRRITLVDWMAEQNAGFHGRIPEDTIEFWKGVRKSASFKTLSNYALQALAIPPSNAVVERIFSMVTLTKTKARNRIGVICLDAIIRIRSHLKMRNNCCSDFKASKKMIDKHNAANLYSASASTSSDSLEDVTEVVASFL